MWPYILLVAVPLIIQNKELCLTARDKQYRTKQLSMKLFWILLLVLLILRHDSVGRDLSTYRTIFQSIAQSDWKTAVFRNSEIGFNFLCKSISIFSVDFRYIIVISALLAVYSVSRAYIRYSNDTALTVSLLIITSNFVLLFSGLKQAIAISIGLLAFEQVRKRQIVVFLLITFIAMLFHTSAFMLLFMYPLYHLRLHKGSLLWIVPSLAIVFVFNEQLFSYLTNILALFTKYDGTIQYTGSYTMLVLFIIFAIFSYVVPDESSLDCDTLGMRNFLLFAVALQMFAPLHTIAMRMNYYYIIFIPLLIPRIINCCSQNWKQVAYTARHVMIIFFVSYFFIKVVSDNSLDAFPYHFIWDVA